MAQEAEQLSYPNSDNISVLALRLLSTAATTKPKEEKPQGEVRQPGDDPLENAIADIEAIIKQYEGEIDK